MDDLIKRIAERAHDPARATDEGQGICDRKGNPIPYIAAPPALPEEIAAAEEMLGFALPELLRRLYTDVGNGGFGPGYGLFGVPCGPKRHKVDSAIKYYLGGREMAVDSKKGCRWPEGLLPICEWGCGIQSSLDCTRPEVPVIRHDPNMEYEDIEAELAAWQKFAGYERLF